MTEERVVAAARKLANWMVAEAGQGHGLWCLRPESHDPPREACDRLAELRAALEEHDEAP